MFRHFPFVIILAGIVGLCWGCENDTTSNTNSNPDENVEGGGSDGGTSEGGGSEGGGSEGGGSEGGGSEGGGSEGGGSEGGGSEGGGSEGGGSEGGGSEGGGSEGGGSEGGGTEGGGTEGGGTEGGGTEGSTEDTPKPITITDIARIVSGGTSSVNLQGKKVVIVGNSFVYYGKVVIKVSTKNIGKEDHGYFYEAAKQDGGEPIVYNFTEAGKELNELYDAHLKKLGESMRESIDYVLLSEAGRNNKNIVKDVTDILKLFPNAKCVFMPHEYFYKNDKTPYIINNLENIKKEGCLIANAGQLVSDLYKGNESVENSSYTYNRSTFIITGDSHHTNPLEGYLKTLLAYTAITGKSAVGMEYKYTDDTSINQNFDLKAFRKKYYNNVSDTNFYEIMHDDKEIEGLQKLVDKYNAKWNGDTSVPSCEHEVNVADITETYFYGSSNTSGVASAVCSKCHETVTVEIKTDEPRTNIMLVTPEDLQTAGKTTVKDYMDDGMGSVFYQKEDGWGRMGYSSIYGMASMCDGNRKAVQTKDASQLYWEIADKSKKYDANGQESDEGKYLSLIGYRLTQPKSVSGFTLFIDAIDGSLTGFDLLGGVKNDDDTYSWNVLWSGSDIAYTAYDRITKFIHADFDEIKVDAIQIGVTSTKSDVIYASELEVYGH